MEMTREKNEQNAEDQGNALRIKQWQKWGLESYRVKEISTENDIMKTSKQLISGLKPKKKNYITDLISLS